MFSLDAVTPERCTRFHAGGLTRYTAAQVAAAVAALADAEAAYDAAVADAAAVLAPHMTFLGAILSAPAACQSLYGLLEDQPVRASLGKIRHGSRKAFPLTLWAHSAKSHLSHATRIRKGIEACHGR